MIVVVPPMMIVLAGRRSINRRGVRNRDRAAQRERRVGRQRNRVGHAAKRHVVVDDGVRRRR